MIRRTCLALAAAAPLVPAVAPIAQPATAGVQAPRPVEHFAVLPFMERPLLSPDGTKLAAKLAVEGKQYFAVLPLDGGRAKLVPSGGKDINWWRWVNDEWLVVGIGALDKLFGDEFYVRRAIGVSADAQKIVPLAFTGAAQLADRIIWIADDGTPRIRLAVQKSLFSSEEGFWPEVIEIDVSTGKSKRVLRPEPGVTNWYADSTGAVRIGIGFSDDGRSARLLYRDGDSGDFKTVNKANSRKGQKLLVPSLFLEEPGQALAIDDRDGYDAVYKLRASGASQCRMI